LTKHLLYYFLVLIYWQGLCAQAQTIEFTPKEQHWLEKHPVIQFGYEPRWEPYEVFKDGEYAGIVGEYVKIIEEKTGIDMRPLPDLSWNESMNGLLNGTIKVVPSCAMTPNREKDFLFSKPYISDPLVIVTKKNGSYYGNLEDLKGETISLSKNYYTIELIKRKFPDVEIKRKKNIAACLDDVLSGKTTAFIGNLNVVKYYFNHHGYSELQIAGVTPFGDTKIGFAVNPEWSTFRDIIDKVLINIPAHQKHEIRKKWITQDSGTSFSRQFMIWLVVIISAIVVCLCILYYWNNVMRKIIKRKKSTEQQLKESLVASKQKDEEKKILLQEIHHRVKNNLQIVSSMMRIQSDVVKDEIASKTLKEAVERIKTIALVHDRIYKSPDVNKVQLREYIHSLYQDICAQFQHDKQPQIKITGDRILINMERIVPLALILNELITNSVKYAFDDQDQPLITIDVKQSLKIGIELTYADNGRWKENESSDYFGSSLIEIFTDQLEGDFQLNKTSTGTTYDFIFKTLQGVPLESSDND